MLDSFSLCVYNYKTQQPNITTMAFGIRKFRSEVGSSGQGWTLSRGSVITASVWSTNPEEENGIQFVAPGDPIVNMSGELCAVVEYDPTTAKSIGKGIHAAESVTIVWIGTLGDIGYLDYVDITEFTPTPSMMYAWTRQFGRVPGMLDRCIAACSGDDILEETLVHWAKNIGEKDVIANAIQTPKWAYVWAVKRLGVIPKFVDLVAGDQRYSDKWITKVNKHPKIRQASSARAKAQSTQPTTKF